MSVLCILGLALALAFLPEPETGDGSACVIASTALCAREPHKFRIVYRYIVVLGFTTYFMAMAAATAFPLSLKEQFLLDPFTAGLCSVIDGPLIFASNFFFIKYLTSLSRATKFSVVASAMFGLIALVPLTTASVSLFSFLLLKYMTSIAGPIVFSAIVQTMVTVCPQNVCGMYAGLLSFFNGIGRLAAVAAVGPLFHRDPDIVYNAVAFTGIASAVVFVLLLRALASVMAPVDLKTPLISHREDEPHALSRQISLLYTSVPAIGQVSILSRNVSRVGSAMSSTRE
jgi:hypothetical protein